MSDYTSPLYQHYRTITFENANSQGFDAAVREIDATFSRLLPLSMDARILDLGCGMGHFLNYLQTKGYRNVVGVDVSAEQVEYCRNHVSPDVFLTDDVVRFLRQGAAWDCIVMKDVIEHLPRTQVLPVLGAIFDRLKEGGTVIVETGNMASATGLYLRNIDFTHECGFTEVSLKQVLLASGFQGITVSGQSWVMRNWRSPILYVLRAMWRQALKAIYFLERGGAGIPKVLSNYLIARGSKGTPAVSASLTRPITGPDYL